MQSFISNIFNSRFAIPLTLFLLTLVTYINILPNKLFYDDEELIYKNAYVQNLSFFPKYFTENMIAGAGKSSNMYRPILLISLAVDYVLWKNNPLGYHLTSIILHSLNAILVFLILKKLFQKKILALLTSILFVLHPIQTESVAYASGRTDLLFSFFCLFSILFFLTFLDTRTRSFFISSIVLFVLAILSKETAVMLPLLLLFLTFLYKKSNIKNKLLYLTPFFLISVCYFLLRLTLLNFGNTLNFYSGKNLEAPLQLYSSNISVRVFTFAKVFWGFLGITFFPKDLIFSRNAEIISSFFNPFVLAFLILIIIFFFSIFRYKNKVFVFSFFWVFISLLPVSGIIPINNIYAEHYFYFPLIGIIVFCLYPIVLLPEIVKSRILRLFTYLVFFLISVSLFIRTNTRNNDWKNPITFYTVSLKQSPQNIPMRNNLAMAYADVENLDMAIKEYKNILALSDVYPNPHHNLANVYKQKGLYKEAEEEYKKALAIDPNFFFSMYGLAELYQKTGQKEELIIITEKLEQIQKSKYL